jgi:serine/threonine-protein kinase HipA
MMMPEIHTCPGTLATGYISYSPRCLRNLFLNRKVSHILPYDHSSENYEDEEKFIDNRKRISISGVQEKVSLLLEKNNLRLTEEGEQGTYILKPIPRDIKHVDFVPANEHLTMQIAQQIYSIYTAENALIFFKNGKPAYITKRFDIKGDSSKKGIEDFACLTGKTSDNSGSNYKYNLSYEELAENLKKNVPAAVSELEKLFKLILFNYLFSNGDAHLKNFSLLEMPEGDYALSPAYDLLNTHLHVDDSYMALEEGLFKGDFETGSYSANGCYAYDDFYEFGLKIGLNKNRMIKTLDEFRLEYLPEVESMVSRSYLSQELKKTYFEMYKERLKMLNYSYNKRI